MARTGSYEKVRQAAQAVWIERPRRWLSGRLETNINIDNTEGHRVPHPVLTNKLSLVPHGLAHVRLRRPCNYLHRYSYGPSR